MRDAFSLNDMDKLTQLFTELGIGFQLDAYTKGDKRRVIRCEEGNKKITGYSLFYTDFVFDLEGNFIEMGAWE